MKLLFTPEALASYNELKVQQYPHVYDMILREFDLPPERTTAKYAIHWDIGQSWR